MLGQLLKKVAVISTSAFIFRMALESSLSSCTFLIRFGLNMVVTVFVMHFFNVGNFCKRKDINRVIRVCRKGKGMMTMAKDRRAIAGRRLPIDFTKFLIDTNRQGSWMRAIVTTPW